MKKIIITILLIIPIFIKAETYEQAINKANNYIFNFENFQDYIYLNDEIPYNYENSSNNVKTGFRTGGLLSKEEYLITNFKNSSYLATGIEYWTLTQYDAENQHVIDISLSNKNINLNSNTRVSQFVENDVEVTGSGTKSNPWTFKNIFSVTLQSTNKNRGMLSLSDCQEHNKKAEIVVRKFDSSNSYFYTCASYGFEYNSEKSSCKSFVTSISENKYELKDAENKKLVDNMICTIDFAYQTTKVELVNSNETKKAEPFDIYIAKIKNIGLVIQKVITQ